MCKDGPGIRQNCKRPFFIYSSTNLERVKGSRAGINYKITLSISASVGKLISVTQALVPYPCYKVANIT